MVMPFRQKQYGYGALAGARCVWFGDSIGAPFYYGQAWDQICAATGMAKVGGNMINNGGFEPDANLVAPAAWVVTVGCTLLADNTRAVGGTKSCKMTATATDAYCAPVGDSGAIRLGMQGGRGYTVSAQVYLPTTSSGTMALIIYDNINDGTGYVQTNGASVSPANAWQTISVSRTLRNNTNLTQAPGGITEAFVRIHWNGAIATNTLWFDNVEMDTSIYTALPPYAADGYNGATPLASSQAGTLLSNKGATANNGTDSFAVRMATSPDVVIVAYGVNDCLTANTYSITASDWRTAVRTCLANCKALASKPLIIWVGIPTTTVIPVLPSAANWVGYDVSSVAALKYSMNSITLQECTDAGVPFVPIFPDQGTSLVQTLTPNTVPPYHANPLDADGVHPTQTGGYDGQTLLANRILRALGVA